MGHNFSAMGTTIEAWTDIEGAPVSLIDHFELVEGVCSRFRSESELTQINRSDDPQVTPSPLMAELLDGAERARTITQGLVDVGVGRSVRVWGYDRTFLEVTDLDREPPPMTRGSWRFHDGVLTRQGEVELDLGGLAKGWTCDQAIEMGLAQVVSAGGDLRSNHPGTRVSVAGPGGDVDVVVELGVGGLATSSTARRAWRAGGRKVSHIVDPRSMRPVETPITSATVLADTAADAEAGAKAIVILGVDGLAWAAAQSWIRGALAFWEDGSLYATPHLELAA
jgi:thiamine biosynthesis lipoprotein